MNALYKLEPITDNPLYDGFAFVSEASLRGNDFLEDDFGSDNIRTKGRQWTVPPLAPHWIPLEVIGRVRSFNDYPCVNLIIPAFSRRAVGALRDFLEPNGELLPLVSDVREYYAYNVTTVADILDLEKSTIQWLGAERVVAADILRFECIESRFADLSIFTIVEEPTLIFVSQVFVDRVHANGLEGFAFIKVWPFPEGVDWRVEAEKTRTRNSSIKTKQRRKPIKGNTVVLMFPTEKTRPTKVENARLAALMDQLDGVLCDDSKAGYAGSLEGDDVVAGELRLFLSCPDADVLLKKLRPWLKSISWGGDVKVLKRYGEMQDANCTEEYVEL